MSGLRARAHPNGSSSLEAAVQHNGAQAPPCCNGHGHDHAHTHPAANDPRRPRRALKVKNTAFSTYYGAGWESQLQFCLLMTLLVMACIFASWKLFGGGGPLPQVRYFRAKSSYTIPGSMKRIGDKSKQYQWLRQEYDEMLPYDPQRSLKVAQAMHKHTYRPIKIPENAFYDIYNCPFDPPEGYPYAWNILDVLKNWPPDDPTPHLDIHQGWCVFDYQTEYDKAKNYRNHELPFVVRGDPEVASAVERWNAPGYMERLMNTVLHRAEYSENNHFLYWMKPNVPAGGLSDKQLKKIKKKKKNPFGGPWKIEAPANWSQPTKMLRMEYKDWFVHANVTDDQLGPNKPHWYYRLIGCGDMGKCDAGSSEYLFDELTFFQPRPHQLYLREFEKQKGIHCRFGMKGVIAENHFDGSRNSIVVLGGERRYILSHPDQCELLALYPKEHPSARHSAVDWSDPDLDTFPEFGTAEASEVVLQAGDVMYLPTNWFHYIISLDLNFQCNTRSGVGQEYMPPIQQCGF